MNILFNTFPRTWTVLYTFYFAYSMLSVIDELCMTTYINVCNFHWILLIIRIDDGTVEVMDSLRRDTKEYKTLTDMLQK